MPTLAERIGTAIERTGSLLCLGLDPDIARCPTAGEAEDECARLLDAVLPYCCAVKPNLAFFEQHGSAGYAVLERLRARVPDDRVLIVDGKRGDIASTAEAYARAAFDVLGADAVTVNPLMGEDSVRPFLERPGRGALLLTRTTNPGAADLLERRLDDGVPLYRRIASLAGAWDPGGAVGLVVGATAPGAVAEVRAEQRRMPLLVPGVGAQGGALEAAVRGGLDAGGGGLVVSVSRALSAAGAGAATLAASLRDQLEAARRTSHRRPSAAR